MAIELRLRGGVARASQRVQHGDLAGLGDECGEFGGLVEFAFAKADVMQRHGDEGIEWLRCDARVIEGGGEPVCERMAEMELAAVFERMDEVADDTAAEIRRDSAVEMHFASGAV